MTHDRAPLHLMMEEIGPLLDLAAVAELEGGLAWELAVDEETVVGAEYDEEEDRLVLSAAIAQPPEEERLALYELFLVYNGQWDLTGGLRMSLEAPGGAVVQSLELALSEIDLARLATILQNFLDIRKGWLEILAEAGDHEPDEGPKADSGKAPPPGSVRV